MRHVKTILNVPLALSPLDSRMKVPSHLRVWGMVYRENRTPANGPQPGPLNGVTEMLRQPDLRRTAREPLNFFCNGVFRAQELQEELGSPTHYGIMLALQGLGIRVNRPYLRICRQIQEVMQYSLELKEDPERFPCEISGAVVTLNPLERLSRVDGAAPSPFWVIAFGSGGR